MKELELGQVLFGNPIGEFIMPDYASALMDYLLNEIDRVFRNKEQREWDWREDPKFQGITFNPYCWNYEDNEQQLEPNFKINNSEQEIRWYKYPGRGQTCTINMTPNQWVDWFNNALKIILSNDILIV